MTTVKILYLEVRLFFCLQDRQEMSFCFISRALVEFGEISSICVRKDHA
jgi:hypothetical protein